VYQLGKSSSILLGFLLVLMVAGCGSSTKATNKESQAASAAVVGYMQGRRDNNLPAAYKHLSKASQELYSQEEFISYYGQFPVMNWQRVGETTKVSKDWIRVMVYDIRVTSRDGSNMPLPDFAYYVQKSGGKWGIALINPILSKLDDASNTPQLFQFIDSLLKVHPYSGSLFSRLYYAYMSMGELQEAEEALGRYYQVSTPSELPGFQAMQGHFFLSTGYYGQAVEAYTSAMKIAPTYAEIYPDTWHSRMMTFQGHAYLEVGELILARQVLEQAVTKDPNNQDAQELLRLIRGR